MNIRLNPSDLNEPLLSDEETKRLIKLAQQGDEQARERLARANLRLVLSVVNRFSNRGYDMEDLFQLGTIGLMKAIDKFDLSYDVKFSTYAVPLIVGEIRRFLRDNSPLKVSRSLKQTAYQAKRKREELRKKLGREATLSELAASLALSPADLLLALEAVRQPTSIYEEVYQDDGNPIYVVDQISDDSQDEKRWVDKIGLQEALSQLTARERQIIVLRYFQEKTQTEVAKILGVSQVQVSRLEKRTLQKIRKLMAENDTPSQSL